MTTLDQNARLEEAQEAQNDRLEEAQEARMTTLGQNDHFDHFGPL